MGQRHNFSYNTEWDAIARWEEVRLILKSGSLVSSSEDAISGDEMWMEGQTGIRDVMPTVMTLVVEMDLRPCTLCGIENIQSTEENNQRIVKNLRGISRPMRVGNERTRAVKQAAPRGAREEQIGRSSAYPRAHQSLQQQQRHLASTKRIPITLTNQLTDIPTTTTYIHS